MTKFEHDLLMSSEEVLKRLEENKECEETEVSFRTLSNYKAEVSIVGQLSGVITCIDEIIKETAKLGGYEALEIYEFLLRKAKARKKLEDSVNEEDNTGRGSKRN